MQKNKKKKYRKINIKSKIIIIKITHRNNNNMVSMTTIKHHSIKIIKTTQVIRNLQTTIVVLPQAQNIMSYRKDFSQSNS